LGGPICDGSFMANILVGVENLPKFPPVTVKDYAKLLDMQEKKVFLQDFVHLEEYDSTVANLPAVIRTYNYSYGGQLLKGTQIIMLKNNTVYLITYTSTDKSFDKYRQVLDDIANSFKFQ
jgi:hypothetical protein